jgi:hypothetical protein
MRAEIRHFFETATDKEKSQAKAFINHRLNTIRIKAEAARKEELGVEHELSGSRSSER